MLQAAVDSLIQSRQRLANHLKAISREQWFTQPYGFANNVAWNVGHLIVAQQGLCYRRVEVAAPLDDGVMADMHKMYGGGTSPADWSENPNTDELLRLFVELPQKLSEDIAAGKFDDLVMPEPVDGRFPPPKTMMHALVFNQFHEGTHFGTIGELLGYMKAKE